MYQFVLTSGNEEVVRPPTDSHVDVSNILGRDKVKGDLVSILLGRGNEEERSPHVISLVGMGGVGKTTLAQLAYNDSELNLAHFEKKGWVCVSDPFNKFMVAKAIIQAFEGDDSNITQWPSLMDKMCELIRGRKLFLVFDDVWTEDSTLWEPFRLALQNAAQGSRILVTTRKNRVADIMESTARINLGQLSDDDCWTIFSTIAFSGRDSNQCKELEDEFQVNSSSILRKRYQRGTGVDWPKISYIPNIKINYIEVQRDGQEVIRQAMMKKSLTKNSMSDDEEEGQNLIQSQSLKCFVTWKGVNYWG
nr:putative disease resistance protein rga3 [Quercus suber]